MLRCTIVRLLRIILVSVGADVVLLAVAADRGGELPSTLDLRYAEVLRRQLLRAQEMLRQRLACLSRLKGLFVDLQCFLLILF